MATTFSPEARTSCARCHKRKKRCDRLLPSCKNCQLARVRCSFLDNDSQTTASYPIAYVRSLEARLHSLEKRLTSSGPPVLAPGDAATSPQKAADVHDPFLDPACSTDMDDETTVVAATISSVDESLASTGPKAHSFGPPSPQRMRHSQTASMASMGSHPSAPVQSPSFAQELKSLSLEAAAERHVGSSSGVSFAKLTQLILCRLTPDKADFVFSNETASAGGGGTSNNTSAGAVEAVEAVEAVAAVTADVNAGDPQLIDFDSPSDLFNSTVLHSLSESISVYPLLFGDVFLTDIMEPESALAGLSWPPSTSSGLGDEAHINRLVDFYFAHSNTLYPIIVRRELMETLRAMQADPQAAAATLPPLDLFRIWMVLAIGATAFSAVSLTEESEPMLYYNKALQYSEQALALDEMAALEVLTLQVSYSFFNQLGPNTWFLVGISARVALGLGLHTASTYEKLPVDVSEKRKRIFFSIYMMDRVVSIALGRPFALHDDDIDVTPFAAVDDDCITPEQILPQSSLQPSIMCVPRHILALRQIASRIARQVYSSSASRQASSLSAAQRERVLTTLHQELIDWRRNMPFPLPDVDRRVPHLSSTWYDFNYYTHLASIYRPSPLFPVMDHKRVKILESAAAMAVRHAYNLHQQHRLAYNWLNFLSLFTATLSLIYATTAQPENLATVLRETRAIDDLELAIELFNTLSVKFSAARKIRGMVAEICARYRDVKEGN